MTDTRRKLLDGALDAVRTRGIAGVSARSVAAAAGVNQALVFYHYGTLDELLGAACLSATRDRVARYRTRFAEVSSLRGLLDLGRALHEEERAAGNVAVLAQLLAGAQADPALAGPVGQALDLWVVLIEATLRRLVAGSPLEDLVDVEELAPAVSAAFVGLELYEGVDPRRAGHAFDALERLAVLVEVVEDLGPVARRALRARVRRTSRGSA